VVRAALDSWPRTARLCLIYLARAIPAIAVAWMTTLAWYIMR
jgi:hypothetical protein